MKKNVVGNVLKRIRNKFEGMFTFGRRPKNFYYINFPALDLE